ncbi:MAG: NAD-dependent epimerase/dehydratase family protein [Comamonadaceae bacterium]|nr:NAD-dependent epimerase/dehydratase family protein [Comamonadaceae bacterium]
MRNLAAAEIVAQVVTARTVLGWDCRNVVFMGMGEPLDNLEELARALRVLTDQRGLRYPAERLTVCTAGHAEGIRGLRALGLRRVNLSVSLNAADDATRDRLMPVNRRTDLAALAAALAAYPQRRTFVLGVNYCLLPGINDSREDARGVAAWCAKVGRAYVNLIPYNPGTQPLSRAPSPEEAARFLAWLREDGLEAGLRSARGRLDHGRMRAAGGSWQYCNSAGPCSTVIPRSVPMPSVLITRRQWVHRIQPVPPLPRSRVGGARARAPVLRPALPRGASGPADHGRPARCFADRLPRRVDAIIHSASVVSDIVGLEWSIRGIYDPTVRFVEALRAGGVSFGRFVYISTTLVLGWHGFNISEERPGRPADRIPYARAKRRTEEFLLEEHRRTGLPAVILRPADVYGPNDRTSLAMMLEGIEGGISPIVGTGRRGSPTATSTTSARPAGSSPRGGDRPAQPTP